MRLTDDNDNSYIEDRRAETEGGGGGGGFGGGGFPIPIGRMGLGGTVLLLVLSLVFGRNFVGGGGPAVDDSGPPRSAPVAPGAYGAGGPGQGAYAPGGVGAPVRETAEEHPDLSRARAVFNSTQHTWDTLLPRQSGAQYRPARLVLFRDAIQTGCGNAPAAVGPFYCPADEKVYLDLSFFDELAKRFGAPGDFAQAYVVAHEMGHHLQKILGTEARVRQAVAQRPQLQNALSVRVELQADCYAGVWGSVVRNEQLLDPGDTQEALNAASAVGDDRLQRQETGQVRPDTFTHGTSAQRASWFQRGFQSGDIRSCDTFAGGI
ncbi:MAG TPA: neutral zinc metallopeptidase [Gemmatirosa sp.]